MKAKYMIQEGKMVKIDEVNGKQIFSINKISKGHKYMVKEKGGEEAKFKALTDAISPLNDLNGKMSSGKQIIILVDNDYVYFVTNEMIKKKIVEIYEI